MIANRRRQDGGRPVRLLHPRLPTRLRRRHRGGRRLPHERPLQLRRRDQPRQRLAGVDADLQARVACIAWAAMFGHMTDIGGKVPGSLPTDARQIFEEGIRIPPVKIVQEGRDCRRRCSKLILHNCRLPHWNQSDLNALVAACRTAGRRVMRAGRALRRRRLSTRHLGELLERNHRAMKPADHRATRSPRRRSPSRDYICDDGIGMPVPTRSSLQDVAGRRPKVIFDFEGTDPQSEGSINFYLNEEMFKMFCGVFMIMVFDPQIMFNDGFYDLMEVRIPQGSLLKPDAPAALSCRTHALGRIFDVISGLLGPGEPRLPVRGRLFRQPPLHVLGQRPHRAVVPALPDRVWRDSRPPGGRRARRALAVAELHQRPQ